MNTASHVHAHTMLNRHNVAEPLTLPLESLTSAGGRALESLRESVRLYGADALHSVQQRLETLQECFLSIVQQRLHSAGVNPTDKIGMYLADDATLTLTTSDADAHLRDILTGDDELHALFAQMHTLALTAQGIEHMHTAHASVTASPVRYRVCLKGALSHFYLK